MANNGSKIEAKARHDFVMTCPAAKVSRAAGLSEEDQDEIEDDDEEGEERISELERNLVRGSRSATGEKAEDAEHRTGCECGDDGCETRLRALAVTVMRHQARNKPNGTSIMPPGWYTRTRWFPSRPIVWKKDWETGKIRPRWKRDDEYDRDK
ncbi:hypothetical protein QBC40DRAFT_255916 [Triangularia verruculosa]|uniref:Uncharacterized protein n=1 Tax=Triangularia verruculosa TaxID=2587418 RepID=A0AAN6XDH5_9PEZI|nr:hypothetical protein QBC40DRAFT_255916 [Triangularia verruculosa]